MTRPSYSFSEVKHLISILNTEKEIKALNHVLWAEVLRYKSDEWFVMRDLLKERINKLIR